MSPPIPPFPLEVPHLVSSSTDTFQVITPLVVSLRTGSLVQVHRNFWQCARKIGAPPPQPNFTQSCSSEPVCRLFDCHHSKGCHRYLLKIPPSFGLIATWFHKPLRHQLQSSSISDKLKWKMANAFKLGNEVEKTQVNLQTLGHPSIP